MISLTTMTQKSLEFFVVSESRIDQIGVNIL